MLIVADVTPNQNVTSETNGLKTFAQAMKGAKIPQDQDLSHSRKSVQVQLAPVIEVCDCHVWEVIPDLIL